MSASTQHKTINPGTGATPWIPLGEVSQPGAYVSKGAGDLIRITRGGVAPDDETIDKTVERNVEVALISPDPFIRITQARILAANLDVPVSF